LILEPALDPYDMPGPVRIAFVITELDVGGAERALVQLVTGLPRDAWESRVISIGPWGPLVATLQDAGIPVRCLDAVYLWDTPRVLWQLRREFRDYQPQILQTFLFHANILGRIAGRWARVPHVVAGLRVAERRSRFYGWVDRWTNRWVDRNVCVSRAVADFCEHESGLNPRKTVVIPNGVDVAPIQQASPIQVTDWGIPAKAPLILTVARLEHQKGIDLLLAAAPEILAAIPEAHLVILGEGLHRTALERQAAATQFAARIHFLGHRGDVPRWLQRAQVMVLPSRWEGMPNVVLEAMAAGLAVVATDVEGVREVIVDNVNGCIVPAESPQALAEVTMQLLRQPEISKKLGMAAQDVVGKKFTVDAMIQQYAQLYQELSAERR